MTSPTLLLIHGLGSTSGVWADLLDSLPWPGQVINAELAGHGSLGDQSDYTIGALAAGVSAQCPDDGTDVVAVGHSLGGCVALCLASGFYRPRVTGVVGLGIKAQWTDDDVTGMAKVAAKGVRWFETRDDAVDRFLLQAGLVGVADSNHASVETGVTEVDGRWRVSQDPNTFAQRPVDLRGLVETATCPVILAAGENDAMVTESDLAAAVDDPRIAAGRGHNVQVEDPEWVASLITELAGS